jgi:hypothetical protein
MVSAQGIVVKTGFGEDTELYVVPGTYVYWASVDNSDVFFSEGYWWRAGNHGWYRAEAYSGPWVVIETRYIPYKLIHLPQGWRDKRDNSPRIRWGDARSHWREWEQNKYWEKREWKKEEKDLRNENKRNEKAVDKEQQKSKDRKNNRR